MTLDESSVMLYCLGMLNMKEVQALLEEACVWDSFGDLQSSIAWMQEDDDLGELKNRLQVAIDEADALVEGLKEVLAKMAGSKEDT